MKVWDLKVWDLKIFSIGVAIALFIANNFFGTPAAFAQGNMQSVSFGGACASQGKWTELAIESTQRISTIVTQLKNDSRCKGLAETLQPVLKATSAQYTTSQDVRDKSSRLMHLPNEIGALRGFVASSPDMKGDVMRLMMDRGIETALLSAEVGAKGMSGSDIVALGDRTARMSSSALDMMEAVIGHLPELDQCMMSPDYTGQILSSLVKLGSTFVSSGQAFSSRVAQVLSKLSATLRDRKFTSILRKLDDQQFLASMSCLMETTSEAYCSARDSMVLFQKGNDVLRFRSLKNQGKTKPVRVFAEHGVGIDNPFEGYYLLVNQVPVVTDWLQRIQIGVDPKLETDAQFQNTILDEVNNFLKRAKNAQGAYFKRLETLRTRTSVQAKKNDLLEMLRVLTDILNQKSGNETNFFTVTKNEMEMPFFLVGWNGGLPSQVSGVASNGQFVVRQSWFEWMYQGGKYQDFMNDPERTSLVIGTQLKELIQLANLQATQYYSRWFIVDKPALVNESISKIPYNVIDSLKGIDNYLEGLRSRIQKLGGDPAQLPSIADTQTRIQRVLQTYQEIRKLGNLKPPLSDQQLQKVAEVYDNVVEEVYRQFMVMKSKSGFMANRMANFVFYDYSLMLKRNVDFTPAQEELYYATGNNVIDRMIALYSGNRTNVKTDLETALKLNKGNIEAVEMLLKDNLISAMAKLKMIADNQQPGNWKIAMNSFLRLAADLALPSYSPPRIDIVNQDLKKSKGPLKVRSQFQKEQPVTGALTRLFPGFDLLVAAPLQLIKHQDRYPMRMSPYDQSSSPDDEFHSARNILARLCIQSLAFNDWQAFAPYCNGMTLQTSVDGVSVSASSKLNVLYNQKAYEHNEDKSLNHSLRICAFRDWGRKNFVFWQTMLLDK